MLFLKFFHYLAFAVLIGPLVSAEFVNRMASRASDPARIDEVQVVLGRVSNAALVWAILSGLALVYFGGWHKTLAHQPWLHIMITLSLVAGGLIGVANGRARRMLEEPNERRAPLRRTITMLRSAALLASVGAVASGLWRI